MKIESYIKIGNSLPIVVSHQWEKYLVKLKAGMSGEFALLNEWIGNTLGYKIGIRTQLPRWLEIGADMEQEHIYIEVRELVTKSLGLNIAFDYREDATEIRQEDLDSLDRKELHETLLLDLIMLNVDRTSANMNLMKSEGETYSVDYEASLFVQEVLGNRSLLTSPRILQSFRSNPLYQEIDGVTIDGFL